MGRYQEAVPLLHQALAIDAENSDILCMLAYVYVSLEEYRPALEWASRAVAVDPGEEWGHRLRSVIFMRTKRLKQALEAALTASGISPDGLFTLSNLAEAQVCNNQMKAAEETAQRLLAVGARRRPGASDERVCVHLPEKVCGSGSQQPNRPAPGTRKLPRPAPARDALRGQKRLREAIEGYAESLRRSPTNEETRKALQETAMDYLGWPSGPPLVGVVTACALMLLGLEFRLAIGLGAFLVWGYGRATVRHGLHDVWAGSPKWNEFPPATRAILVDVCRAEAPHYLHTAISRYALYCLTLLMLYFALLIWRGE